MGSYEPTSTDHSKDVLYVIKKSDYVGRYMVAARDIKPGEAIFTDQPACIGKTITLRSFWFGSLLKNLEISTHKLSNICFFMTQKVIFNIIYKQISNKFTFIGVRKL